MAVEDKGMDSTRPIRDLRVRMILVRVYPVLLISIDKVEEIKERLGRLSVCMIP
jgi:hypothetical protein